MSRARLDWSDPIAVSLWLTGLKASFADLDAIGIDMLRPARARELGPAIHARNYAAARAQILAALDFASAPELGPEPGASGPGGAAPGGGGP